MNAFKVPDDGALVSLADIQEIELLILRRVRQMTAGEHRSDKRGTGFDLVGLRDWQAGDRLSAIDWPQSSLTNYSPLVVREFEQPTTSPVIVVADRTPSTRCGRNGFSIAHGVARATATIGLSAVFFNDAWGLMTFDASPQELKAIYPRIGRNHVVHCLEALESGRGFEPLRPGPLSTVIGSVLRTPGLISFVSDFLFDDPGEVLSALARLNATHDVFVVIVDAGFAFATPSLSGGWVEVLDAESGRTVVMSRRTLERQAARVNAWQDEVGRAARELDLDIVRFGADATQSDLALAEFVAERRMRKAA